LTPTIALFAYILFWYLPTRPYSFALVLLLLWIDPVTFWIVVIGVGLTLLIEKYFLKKGA
jgi:hypothetical protein